jgi:hypothetical protein
MVIETASVGRAAETVHLTSPLTPGLRAIAEAYFATNAEFVRDHPDTSERTAAIDLLEGAFTDVDDDGEPEAAFRITERSTSFCGSVGCFVIVLKRIDGRWRDIGGFPDRQSEFILLDEKHRGYHDIQSYFERD